jgi:hypothetical protein
MATFAHAFGPHAPDITYVPHAYDEVRFDTGEVELNYVTVGDAARPALLLIPGQTESWWGYEDVLGTGAGQPFEYVSFPETPHSLHGSDPQRYADTLAAWATTLPKGDA